MEAEKETDNWTNYKDILQSLNEDVSLCNIALITKVPITFGGFWIFRTSLDN